MTLSRFAAIRVNTSMDRELELQLVSRLRTGDPAAFDAVYDAFNARLYNFLARLSNSRDAAEDLTEETWLRLVVHAQRLRGAARSSRAANGVRSTRRSSSDSGDGSSHR